jgi:predicted PolB exonuclease-like 3'-5' exonuclease
VRESVLLPPSEGDTTVPLDTFSVGDPMFRTFPSHIVAFDLEWCPDPVAGRVLYDLDESINDREVVAEMWRQGGATVEEPQPFLKTLLCRVVSVAGVARTSGAEGISVTLFSLPTDCDDDTKSREAQIIGAFLERVGKQKRQLVGFNSIASDLKILTQRAFVHGLSIPEFFKRPDKPWTGVDYFARESAGHVDLSEFFSPHGKGKVSLNDLAMLAGIPGKMAVSGEQVPEMWLEGRWQEIIAYNEFDAVTTYLVWLRACHLIGFLDKEEYTVERELMRRELERQIAAGKTHLEDYLIEWDRLSRLHR